MGYLNTVIYRVRHALERIEILGKAFPLPTDSLEQGGAGNVLDPLHQTDEPVSVCRFDRCKTDPAVAHHNGGNAMPEGRLEQRVPGHLTVVVSMYVDETGSDQQPVSVDFLTPTAVDLPALGYAPTVNGHIGGLTLAPAPIDNRSPAYDRVVHQRYSLVAQGRLP